MLPKEQQLSSLDANGKKKQLVRSNAMCGDDDNRLQAPNASASRRLSSNASSMSRESAATDYTDTTGINLTSFFRITLHKSPKDRQLLLEFEKILQDFVLSDTQAFKFPSMCSYNRMLLHRVSAYFGLDHNVDQSGKAIVVNRTDHTRMPAENFGSMIRNDCYTDLVRMPRRGMQSFDDSRGIPINGGSYGVSGGFYGSGDFASRRARSFDVPDLGSSPVLYQQQQQPMSGSQYSVCSNNSGTPYVPSNILQIVPQDLNESISSTDATASLPSPPIMDSPAFAMYQRQQYNNAFAASYGSPPTYPMTFADGMMFSPPVSNEMLPTSPPCQWSNADGGYATSDHSVGSAPDNPAGFRSAVLPKYPYGTLYAIYSPAPQPQQVYYPASPTAPDQLAQQIGEIRLTNSSSSSDVATGDSIIAQPSSSITQPTFIMQAPAAPQTYPTIGSPEMCYGSPIQQFNPMYYPNPYYQQPGNVMYPVLSNGYAYANASASGAEMHAENGKYCENGTQTPPEEEELPEPENLPPASDGQVDGTVKKHD